MCLCKINKLSAQTKTDWWIVSVCFFESDDKCEMTTRSQVYWCSPLSTYSTLYVSLTFDPCVVSHQGLFHTCHWILRHHRIHFRYLLCISWRHVTPGTERGSGLIWSPLYSVLTSIWSYWSAARPPIGQPLKLSSDWLTLGIVAADWLDTCTLCHWLVCCRAPPDTWWFKQDDIICC